MCVCVTLWQGYFYIYIYENNIWIYLLYMYYIYGGTCNPLIKLDLFGWNVGIYWNTEIQKVSFAHFI